MSFGPSPSTNLGQPTQAGFSTVARLPRGNALQTAITGAKQFRDTLGLPSYADILKQMGGPGSIEYGNAGAAATGANALHDELMNWRNNLESQRQNVLADRAAVQNPTGQQGFKDVMKLNSERLSSAAEDADRQAAEAAGRRGFVGGYNPARTEQNRLEELGQLGITAAQSEREAQQGLMNADTGFYSAEMPGYTASLGGYTDLTKTLAELPTKYLTAYSNLLGGIGGYGDIFGTALKGAMYDDPSRLEYQAQLEREKAARDFSYGQAGSQAEFQRQQQAADADLKRQQQQNQDRLAALYRTQGRDPTGRPYGPANPAP